MNTHRRLTAHCGSKERPGKLSVKHVLEDLPRESLHKLACDPRAYLLMHSATIELPQEIPNRVLTLQTGFLQ